MKRILTKEQIENILDEIKQNPGVDAILLTGSYVYGKPLTGSDLDVFCTTNDGSDWALKNVKNMRFGVEVNVCFNPPDKVRWYMQKSKDEGHGDCIHFWAHGSIVYDLNGIAAQLQKEARELWCKGPGKGKSWIWRFEKHQKMKN